MVTHYIIMSSSYSRGCRIALDYIIDNNTDVDKLRPVISTITSKCGKDVSISIHSIQTLGRSWNDVVQRDHFFKDVVVIHTIEEFIKLINEDRELIGTDIAKYILCKIKCTHLKLEKLVYMCFAEYLCDTGRELFKDKIYAYKYGPVVKSVYEKYKKYGYKDIEDNEIDSVDIHELPAKSRILFATDGLKKVKCIEDTILKYGKCTANELVDITHNQNTPWHKAGEGKLFNNVIDNNIIIKYHKNEI